MHGRLVGIGSVVVLVAVLVTGGGTPGTHDAAREIAITGAPATTQQRQEFIDLVQRYSQVFYVGWLTGDLSAFPTVFYNDPREPLSSHRLSLIATHRTQVDAMLARASTGPVGASTGLLSAEIADVLGRRGDVATVAGTSGGLTPTPAPGGAGPWVEKQVFITEARVIGDRAVVTYVFDSTDSTLLFHFDARQVGVQWYMTNSWITGNP